LVSIDAIGCQRDISKKIKLKGGHYLLALKENQGNLYEDAVFGFKTCSAESVSAEWEYDHGRYEVRKCSIIPSEKVLLPEIQKQWSGLKTLVRVEAGRQIKDRQVEETRYCISDEEGLNAFCFNASVRGYWGIENHLHRYLDVTFREDDCRARTGNAPENLSPMRKFALQIISEYPYKLSLKKRRLKAAYDMEYLKKLIT
jgi:predicted transposase YbfD/YdcC